MVDHNIQSDPETETDTNTFDIGEALDSISNTMKQLQESCRRLLKIIREAEQKDKDKTLDSM